VIRMPIYTTYLAFLTKHKNLAVRLGSCFIYYIARNRGNNAVAPEEKMLEAFMKLKKMYRAPKEQEELWKQYEENYLIQIGLSKDAQAWMEKRAGEAKIGNILLVCYEKDAQHCHRRLLAEEIARRFNVEYKGELEEPVIFKCNFKIAGEGDECGGAIEVSPKAPIGSLIKCPKCENYYEVQRKK